MAFILPNWQNKNNRLYTQVRGKLKQKPVCESQRADHPMWQKRKTKEVESRNHSNKWGVTEKPYE